MNKVLVRLATVKDSEFIIDAQIQMAFETEGLELAFDIVSQGVRAVLDDEQKGKYLIAINTDQKPVACLLTIPEWSDWRNGSVLWIHSVYVLAKFQKQGIYKQMYIYLKELVQGDNHYRGLRLYVDKTNLDAQEVYKKLGMSKEHYELYEWLI
ncbi:MAG: GNAT superfamily N-acetyltransferase [Thermoproteota archaeon]|jgi:GNAT superfamily N-acetyltransferase